MKDFGNTFNGKIFKQLMNAQPAEVENENEPNENGGGENIDDNTDDNIDEELTPIDMSEDETWQNSGLIEVSG